MKYKVGDKVLFNHGAFDDWKVGRIVQTHPPPNIRPDEPYYRIARINKNPLQWNIWESNTKPFIELSDETESNWRDILNEI